MSMTRSDSALVLFTLSPEAEGRRKPIGASDPEQATIIFTRLIERLEGVCHCLPSVDLLVACPEPPSTDGRKQYVPQRGRDFGESLRLALEDAFSLGYRKVVVIGNDAPEIGSDYLEAAFAKLRTGSAVLGRASDGGYNLLGLTAPCASAFEQIPWGTPAVASLTAQRLQGAGFVVHELPVLDDIDNPESLALFLNRAIRLGDRSLRRLAEKIRGLLARTPPRIRPTRVRRTLFVPAHWQLMRGPPDAASQL